MATIRIALEEVVGYFDELEDPRSTINQKHPFISVVVIALMAVLAGANGPTTIAQWAKHKEAFLLRVLDLPHGAPRKDVFRRVLSLLHPAAFQTCFSAWLLALRDQAVAASQIEQPILPWMVRPRGAATIARKASAHGIRSVCGPASWDCRWDKSPVMTNRTKSRQFPSF